VNLRMLRRTLAIELAYDLVPDKTSGA